MAKDKNKKIIVAVRMKLSKNLLNKLKRKLFNKTYLLGLNPTCLKNIRMPHSQVLAQHTHVML